MKKIIFTFCMDLCERIVEDDKTSMEDKFMALISIEYLNDLLNDEEENDLLNDEEENDEIS